MARAGEAEAARRAAFRAALADCRAATLALYGDLDEAAFRAQPDPALSALGWHLGHIAYTESYWVLERCAGQAPPAAEVGRRFRVDALAKDARGPALPRMEAVQAFAAEVRTAVDGCLETLAFGRHERLLQFVLQHEAMHQETATVVRYLLARAPVPAPGEEAGAPGQVTLQVPAGPVARGADGAWALDNERAAHEQEVPRFAIDRYPVTVGQFAVFMAAGGYEDRRWWTEAGWAWRGATGVAAPRYWREDLEDHPVCGVSVHEAEAYCRFARARLPTEAEWERAAQASRAPAADAPYPWGEAAPDAVRTNAAHALGHTSAVTAHRAGRSGFGCDELLGNVWEWTASAFAPYPGFAPFPYEGYSAPYFDGRHRVMKGGSFATPYPVLRRSFRNWYPPETRQVFVGFRLARDG